MNKTRYHRLLPLFRTLLAAAALSLSLGPALSSADPAGPACAMPCCAQAAPEMSASHHVLPKPADETAGCRPAAAGIPCDLDQAPVPSRMAAVLSIPSSPSTPDLIFQGMLPDIADSRAFPGLLCFKTAVVPSSSPPLFLSHGAFLY